PTSSACTPASPTTPPARGSWTSPTARSTPPWARCCSPPPRAASSASPTASRTTSRSSPTSPSGWGPASCTPPPSSTRPPGSWRSTSPAPGPGSSSTSTSRSPAASAAPSSSTSGRSTTGRPRATPRSPATSATRGRCAPSARPARRTRCRSSCPATGCCAATAAWAATSAGCPPRSCCSSSNVRPEPAVGGSGVATTINWAGNHVYAGALVRPASLTEVSDAVAGAEHVRVLGTRHTFNDLADSEGLLVSLDRLAYRHPRLLTDGEASGPEPELDELTGRVRVAAATRYADLALFLEERGRTLVN